MSRYLEKPQKVYFFGTCLVDMIYPEAGLAGIKLIQREGVGVIFPPRQTCCGQPAYNSGFPDEAKAVARKQIELFTEERKVRINDVYKLFKWLNLKKDFMVYLINKTHFSYSINGADIEPYKKNYKDTLVEKYSMKFSEFVYLILSEYIILHNYMFVSKLKLKEIKSIDRWLRNIK